MNTHKDDLLIFDLDGTLLDTLEDLWVSVNHALAQFSIPQRSKDEIRQFLGNGIQVLIHKAVGEGVSKEIESKVFEVFRAYYLIHQQDSTKPYQGILPMLHECKQRGFRTAIVSNKVNSAVQDLYHHFFSDCIDIAIGEQQPAIRRKPAPDMVFAVIDKLKPNRNEHTHIYYIGDSEVDLATAANAQIPCISVSWGFRDEQFLKKSGAYTIINHPEDLFNAINTLQS